MRFTVSDFYHMFHPSVKILTGEKHMDRQVSAIGILDYELDPALKNKYFHLNFQEGQLALTTFLYAKDNPFLIGDAVKHLVSRGCSGLAIKNVFHLNIHETVLRYAESKGFPIFVMDSPEIYFEDIIYKVTRQIELMSSSVFSARELDALLCGQAAPEEICRRAKNLNPSFQEHLFAVFARRRKDEACYGGLSDADYLQIFEQSTLHGASRALIPYQSGLLYIDSCDGAPETDMKAVTEAFCSQILQTPEDFYTGVSSLHYHLSELPAAIMESMRTCRLAQQTGAPLFFDDLGSLRLLLPLVGDPQIAAFSDGIMDQLAEYDAEHNGRLSDTLGSYCQAGCSISAAAAAMAQHENTLRYRLDKIREITGLDYKSPADMEQLSLAWKIHFCGRVLE